MIKAVVFDMDGVLCEYRVERRLALLASWSGRSPDAIHDAIWGSGFEDEAERGVTSADDYLKGFGERMGYPLSEAQWVEARKVAMEIFGARAIFSAELGTAQSLGLTMSSSLLGGPTTSSSDRR